MAGDEFEFSASAYGRCRNAGQQRAGTGGAGRSRQVIRGGGASKVRHVDLRTFEVQRRYRKLCPEPSPGLVGALVVRTVPLSGAGASIFTPSCVQAGVQTWSGDPGSEAADCWVWEVFMLTSVLAPNAVVRSARMN
jgi:hypothetical protein